MLQQPKCPVIALEEHYWDKELAACFIGGEGVRHPDMLERLCDLGEIRLREMDEAGIDMQIPPTARLWRRSFPARTRWSSRAESMTGCMRRYAPTPNASVHSRRSRRASPRPPPTSSSALPSSASRGR